MSALADLFSAESPPPSPRNAPAQESLFFSPGATPRASQRSAPGSPSSPSRTYSRLRRRSASPSASRARSASASSEALDPRVNRHGAGVLHARVGGRSISVEDDAFDVQDPLGPGPLTGGAYASGPADPLAPLREIAEVDGTDEPTRKRRRMAKVDYDRLLAPHGLPRLVKIAKGWKVRGKGKEKDDLACLVDMYTVWAHGMFPKGDFKYTMKRVEAVCRTNRMINAIAGLKETFYAPPDSPSASPAPPDDALPDLDAVPEHVYELAHLIPAPPLVAAAKSRVAQQQPAAVGDLVSRSVARDLFDEGPDEDELAALQDAEAAAGSSAPPPPRGPRLRRYVPMGEEPADIGEEDDW